MKIKDIGEFGLIDRIQRTLPPPGRGVLVGIGDDVAVLAGDDDRVWLATCDVQVEGAHFVRQAVDPQELGRKALAINLSDIAAAAGTPRYALVSLGLPGDLDVEFIDGLYAGLRQEAQTFGVDIVGGNISQSRLGLFLDIFLLGQAPRANILLRSGARAGDKILVTGTLGDAAAGVALVTHPSLVLPQSYAERAQKRLALPTPRVREGQLIGAVGGLYSTHLAHAMLDVSDGLASDLGHICEQSKVGARIIAAELPVAPENRRAARELHGDEWHFALYGGEDYELLFTAPAENAAALVQRIWSETGTPVTVIGEILPPSEARQLVLPDGRAVPLEARGWDHFKIGER